MTNEDILKWMLTNAPDVGEFIENVIAKDELLQDLSVRAIILFKDPEKLGPLSESLANMGMQAALYRAFQLGQQSIKVDVSDVTS